jgi:hypothetical protein
MSAFIVGAAIYNIIKDKELKKSTIAKLIVRLLILLLCIVDMFFWCSGGISKLTEIEKLYGFDTM